jgi:hypothetical protein
MSCQVDGAHQRATGLDPDGQLAAEPQLSPTFTGGLSVASDLTQSRTPACSRDLSPTCSHRKVGNITGSSAAKLRSQPTHQALRCVGQHQSARLRASSPVSYEEDALATSADLIAERAQLPRRQSRRFGASEPSLRQIDCFGDSLRRRVCRGRHVVRRVILKACGHSITLGRQRVLVVVPARHPTMLAAPARQPRIELRLQWFIRETFGH